MLTEWGKGLAEVVRGVPGLGYSSKSVALDSLVGSQTVLEAERDAPGYWRGAPSLEYDSRNDRLLTHVRHRNPKERGKRISIYQIDKDTLEATELVSLGKEELGAHSMEGGELVLSDGEFRWVFSYQDEITNSWGLHERRSTTIEGLQSGGTDIEIQSEYFHNKDPALVNGSWYVISNSRRWLHSAVEQVQLDANKPTTKVLTVEGFGNARITSGGIVRDEVFTDVWPNFPGTDIPNFLWTSDERSASGRLDGDALNIESTTNYVSRSMTSVTYVDAIAIGETVTMLWQTEQADGSNDLVGTNISIEKYKQLFVNTLSQ